MASINSNNIPLDIWGEILVRLPAESVIRSRAVSKGWLVLIDDPCFVRAHTYNNQQHQLSSSKVIIRKSVNHSTVEYSLDLGALKRKGCSSNGHHAITAVPLDLDVISDGRFSSCNGLVLSQNPAAFTMSNPLTHEQLDLPPAQDFSKNDWQAFGLGYDSANDNYKAVVILTRSLETHVYSLKSDSWRRNKTNLPVCNVVPRGPFGPGVFACGALNWSLFGNIVALDMRTEKYSLLQVPPLLKRWSEMLIVLGGRLALCDYPNESYLDVWAMKVFGDEDTWFKLFSIDRSEQQNNIYRDLFRPIAFTMNEKLVFLQEDYDRFFLFDVETKSLKWVKINGSIITKDSYVWAQQMFVGTIFRLNANCGGGGGVRTSCTKMKKKKKASERGCRLINYLINCLFTFFAG